jgi:acyl-CoA reductase-like NAD-dependent aldehyde dehydrogenase
MTNSHANRAGPSPQRSPQEVVVRCPANGEDVGAVPVTPRAKIEAIAARLRDARPAWQAMGPQKRGEWLGKWRDWLLDHEDELSRLLQRESGKS